MNVAFYLLAPVAIGLAWLRPWSRAQPVSRSDAEFDAMFPDVDPVEDVEAGSSSPDPVERRTYGVGGAVGVGHD